jgi:hypothetical protein
VCSPAVGRVIGITNVHRHNEVASVKRLEIRIKVQPHFEIRTKVHRHSEIRRIEIRIKVGRRNEVASVRRIEIRTEVGRRNGVASVRRLGIRTKVRRRNGVASVRRLEIRTKVPRRNEVASVRRPEIMTKVPRRNEVAIVSRSSWIVRRGSGDLDKTKRRGNSQTSGSKEKGERPLSPPPPRKNTEGILASLFTSDGIGKPRVLHVGILLESLK